MKMIKFEDCPNIATYEAFCKCYRYLLTHNRIMVSISGGADSDIILDMVIRVANAEGIPLDKIRFVWFNTGIEYQATIEHLEYLEERYGIKIERQKAKKPIPIACKEYWFPFLSKDISAKINSLQNNKFDFKNDGELSYEDLEKKYPKCKSVLKWWCNTKPAFNIKSIPFLKEFMIKNPPQFKISSRCCDFSKKMPSKDYEKSQHIDLKIMGLRKSEGGVRATAHKSCFTDGCNSNVDNYRPIWWFTDEIRWITRGFTGLGTAVAIRNTVLKERGAQVALTIVILKKICVKYKNSSRSFTPPSITYSKKATNIRGHI